MNKIAFYLLGTVGVLSIILLCSDVHGGMVAFWASRAVAIACLGACFLIGHLLKKAGLFDGVITEKDNEV